MTTTMKPDIASKQIATELSKVLADSYTLYLKTQFYHWNVTGPQFHSLHSMFEEEYTDLATAVDGIAERIRSIGFFAPGSFRDFLEIAEIEDAGSSVPTATEMLETLAADNETVRRGCEKLAKLAAEHEDEATADMMIARMQVHAMNSWMLRSSLPTQPHTEMARP